MINTNWDEWKNDFSQFTNDITDDIDFDKIQLSSKDSKLIDLNVISSKDISKKDILKKEFPNIPLNLFFVKSSELKKTISYWLKFIHRTGKVVNIISKGHPRIFIGCLKLNEKTNNGMIKNCYTMLNSRDTRNPPIIIPNDSIISILEKQQIGKTSLFSVQLTKWKNDSLYPEGTILELVGDIGQADAEIKSMLLGLGISEDEFPPEALEEYTDFDSNWKIPEEELNKRKDLRQECIFTIDPETAKDLDDAVSFKILPNNQYEVGVHIADVSYFIKEDSKLDLIARDSATSVYLASKCIPMLPHLFSQNLCSLNPSVDRLAFSIIFKMDQDANIIHRWFGRTIINSCCKLNYSQAQMLLENEHDDNIELDTAKLPCCSGKWTINDIKFCLRSLNSIAKTLRTRRFDCGSIYFEKTKMYFTLDENGIPETIHEYVSIESMHLIEELMLLANQNVAEILLDHFAMEGKAFLRRHKKLSSFHLKLFNKFISNVTDIKVELENNVKLANSLIKLKEKELNNFKIATLFLIKQIKLAEYICVKKSDKPESYHHYALNFNKYTHFTSPIRRYADIIVHRLLASILKENNGCNLEAKILMDIARNCNVRKYHSMLASEKCFEIYLKLYILKLNKVNCNALVFQVLDRSFDILILDYNIVQRIYTDQLFLSKFEFIRLKDNSQLQLFWVNMDEMNEEQLKQTINIGDELNIQISISENFDFKVSCKFIN